MKNKIKKIRIASSTVSLLLFIKVVNLLIYDSRYTLKSFIICLAGILCIYSTCSYFSPGDRNANNMVNIIYILYMISFFLLLAAKKMRENSQ